MARTTYFSTFIVLLLIVTLSRAQSYLPPPAAQTSVTSTAFNPNIQNPGGTTNSAGTFDVVSLARSSNYEGGNSIAVTTSFVVNSPVFGNSASVTTPGYLTETASSTVVNQNGQQDSATKSSVSLIGSASVSAVSTVDAAMALSPFNPAVYNSLAAYMVSIAAIVFAAVFAL